MLTFDKVSEFTYNNLTYRVATSIFEGHKVFLVEGLHVLAMATYTRIDSSAPGICVSPDFLNISEKLQEFILYHEIGHIVNGHITLDENALEETAEETIERLKKYEEERYSNDSFDKREFVADEYAMRKVGKENAIESLREIEAYMREEFENYIEKMTDEEIEESTKYMERFFNEMDARIKYLESLS